MPRKTYPSDLSDIEWLILQPLIPIAKTGGRPRSVDIRDILNAIFYILRSGCAWRMLPHDFPVWQTDRVWLFPNMAQSGRVGADECRPP